MSDAIGNASDAVFGHHNLQHRLEMALSEIAARRSLLDEIILERDQLRATLQRLTDALVKAKEALEEAKVTCESDDHPQAVHALLLINQALSKRTNRRSEK